MPSSRPEPAQPFHRKSCLIVRPGPEAPVMPAVVLLAIVLQSTASSSGAGGADPLPGAKRASAVRATSPVVIDGRDDDAVWRVAPAITQFREFQPKEDGDPRYATEAKVAYDDRNLYVFIRAKLGDRRRHEIGRAHV